LMGMRERANYFGGTLSVEGIVGQGTVMTVTLDAHAEEKRG
jgi:signal transduction histidine kinase